MSFRIPTNAKKYTCGSMSVDEIEKLDTLQINRIPLEDLKKWYVNHMKKYFDQEKAEAMKCSICGMTIRSPEYLRMFNGNSYDPACLKKTLEPLLPEMTSCIRKYWERIVLIENV